MNPSETTTTEPAITPTDLAAIWAELWSSYRSAEYAQGDVYDSEERYYAKVDVDAAHWNLAYLHDALMVGGRGGYCKDDCTHLAEGLSADRLDALLARVERSLRDCVAKIADLNLSRDGRTHQYHLELLKKALLARRKR